MQTNAVEQPATRETAEIRVGTAPCAGKGVVLAGLATVLLVLPGCLNSGPARVRPPDIDPSAVAHRVIEEYDQDRSGRLSETELRACPAIHQHRERYDSDGDGEVSEHEISVYLANLFGPNVGLMPVMCSVRYDNKPVPNARVRFVPEDAFDGAIQEAEATTDGDGFGRLTVAADQLPDGLRNRRLMQVGLYRVIIEHPSIATNSDEPLGYEVNSGAADGRADFER